jgi:long-subunit acyl-CoA synthetase (AMP-forming)
MRVKGVSVFPGYRDAPRETAEAFDEEGYYRIGDAGFLANAAEPAHGVIFNGRVAEDFKLSTGTWVSVGTLRVKLVSLLAPHVQDVVLTGHDRDEIGMLVFASPQAHRSRPKRWPNASPACCVRCAMKARARRNARRARWCSRSRRASTRARSPTRATSTSARCSRVARPTWRGCMRRTTTRRWCACAAVDQDGCSNSASSVSLTH